MREHDNIVVMTGTLDGQLMSDVDDKTIVLIFTLDNWPSLSKQDKLDIISGGRGGSAWNIIAGNINEKDVEVAGKIVTITIPSGTAILLNGQKADSFLFIIPGHVIGKSSEAGTEQVFNLFPDSGAQQVMV